METIEVYYYIRDALVCIGGLVGLGGAIFLFTKKKTGPGILALLGFFLITVEPILDILIWRVLSYGDSVDWDALNTAYACVSGPAMFLGMVALVAALIIGLRQPALPPPPTGAPPFPEYTIPEN